MDPGDITRVELRFKWINKGFALFTLIFLIFFNIFAPIAVQMGIASDYTIWDALLLLLVTIMSAALCLEMFLTWHEVDDEGIRSHGIFRHNFNIKWDDITSIDTMPAARYADYYGFIVTGKGVKFKLRSWQSGFPEFSILVMRHIPEGKWAGAKGMIMFYSRKYCTFKIPD